MLNNVGGAPNPDYSSTLPQETFMLFQMMFAIITPALISGAMAERIKFKGYVIFILLWITTVYFPLCHMVWGKGGFFNWALGGKIPVLDFAVGMLLLGWLASATVNPAIATTFQANGIVVPLTGSMHQFGNQALAVLCTAAFAGLITFILFKVVDALVGLRVDIEDESIGLDLTQHGERAYSE
jgi:ammonia channel protein AmtB